MNKGELVDAQGNRRNENNNGRGLPYGQVTSMASDLLQLVSVYRITTWMTRNKNN